MYSAEGEGSQVTAETNQGRGRILKLAGKHTKSGSKTKLVSGSQVEKGHLKLTSIMCWPNSWLSSNRIK